MMTEVTCGTSSDVGRMYLAKPGVVVWPFLSAYSSISAWPTAMTMPPSI